MGILCQGGKKAHMTPIVALGIPQERVLNHPISIWALTTAINLLLSVDGLQRIPYTIHRVQGL